MIPEQCECRHLKIDVVDKMRQDWVSRVPDPTTAQWSDKLAKNLNAWIVSLLS